MTIQAGDSALRGAQPFRFEDRQWFLGRQRETQEVVDRLLSERVVVVTGASGVGKTSLIQSGVEPALVRLRQEAVAEATSRSVGPMIILRDWGQRGEPIKLLRDGLLTAAGKIHDTLVSPETAVESLTKLQAGSSKPSFVQLVSALSALDKRGLVLVVDQLEEILRRGRGPGGEAIRAIADVYEQLPRVKLLLSLREEYVGSLRALERAVGGVLSRTFWLPPMTEPTAERVFSSLLRSDGLSMGRTVARRVLRWTESDGSGNAGSRGASVRGTREVDLLGAGTLFLELADYCREHRQTTVSREVVDDFGSQWGAGRIQAGVLERWVSDSFPSVVTDGKTADGAKALADSVRRDLSRRLAVRMAPYLSSSGYKMAVEEEDLLVKAMREDLEGLRVESEQVLSVLSKQCGNKKRPTAKALAVWLERAGVDDRFQPDLLSGPALQSNWPVSQVVADLTLCGFDALDTLERRRILKRVWSATRERRWELVHDGFAVPLTSWAGSNWRTLHDALASPAASRGRDIVVLKPVSGNAEGNREISSVNWRGCWVGGPEDRGPLFDHVSFDDCTLPGTLFDQCTFHDVTFRLCGLGGVIFRNCSFENVAFLGTKAEGLTFLAGTMSNVTFASGPELSQLSLSGVVLGGPVVFEDGHILGAAFTGISPRDDDPNQKVRLGELSIAYSWWDEQSAALLEFDPAIEIHDCGAHLNDGQGLKMR